MSRGCGHCGFAGDLAEKGRVKYDSSPLDSDVYDDLEVERFWNLSRCPNCELPTLEAYTWVEDLMDPPDVTFERIYPTAMNNDALPAGVHKQYEAALKVKVIEPSFYAVGIRRMLEVVCRDQGASGSNLFSQVQDLVRQDKLPGVFAKMADQLRTLGNWGAHAKETEVTADDVPIIQEFADSILEYLYRAPAKVAAVEAAIQKRLNAR